MKYTIAVLTLLALTIRTCSNTPTEKTTLTSADIKEFSIVEG